MIKKGLLIILIISVFNSCITLKIDKDAPPLIDFGTPLVGHFRNGDTLKAVLYTVLFASSVIGLILFAPTQGIESKSIIPVERNISDPIFYSFIGTTLTAFGASSIDSAATYHIINKKIIDLNEIKWDKSSKKTKYEAIIEFREEQKKNNEEEQYKDEIKYYREKLINGLITDDELLFLDKTPILKKKLEKELGYYYVNKELKESKKKP